MHGPFQAKPLCCHSCKLRVVHGILMLCVLLALQVCKCRTFEWEHSWHVLLSCVAEASVMLQGAGLRQYSTCGVELGAPLGTMDSLRHVKLHTSGMTK